MKYLLYILILIFASVSPAFADGEVVEDTETIPQEFKIDEKLYRESIGNDGYYQGGFYAEEKNGLGAIYYSSTAHRRDFGFVPGIVVLDRQVIPLNFISPLFRTFGLGPGFFPSTFGFRFGGLHFHYR